MTLSLPPPVVFTHKEVLHAIELPPLATFLTTLHVPEQLIKLNDILLRYRTPKSYHRVDVREITSSELPDSSLEPETETSPQQVQAPTVSRKRTRRILEAEENGDPVELEEGVSFEDYRARQARDGSTAGDTALMLGAEEEQAFPTVNGDGEAGPSSPRPSTDEATPDQLVRPHKSHVPPSLPLAVVGPPPQPASAEATHHLPPSGPKRRIRELRLDLRTLDAAALFALETWRREVLGLEKLDLDHPDSIWYKDATPSPEPEVVKKRGRPRKSESKSRTPGNKGVYVDELDEAEPERQAKAVAGVEGEKDEKHEKDKDIDKDEVQDIEAFDAMVDNQTVDLTIENVDAIPQDRAPSAVTQKTTPPQSRDPKAVDPTRGPSRPPSPDILLVDAYNVNEEDDSDFAPESSPEPVKRRSRAKQDTNAVSGPSTFPPVGRTGRTHPAFTAAPLPMPLQLGGNSKPPTYFAFFDENDVNGEHDGKRRDQTDRVATNSKSRSPKQRVSISPTRAPISPVHDDGPLARSPSLSASIPLPTDTALGVIGQSLDSAILIPDSPVKKGRKSAFVPSVRESIREPNSKTPPFKQIQSVRYISPPPSRKKGKSAAVPKRIVADRGKFLPKVEARNGRSGTITYELEVQQAYDAIEIEEEEEEWEYDKKRKGPAGDEDEDEWDSFRF